MSAIRGKNTKPEIVVRKFLFGRGFRYRLNHPRLPGHPDIVLRKYRTVIFVNGCAASGMDMIIANIIAYLKRMWISGGRKWNGTRNVMWRNSVNLLQWDGIA